jgi:hypothetical protein
MNGWQVHNDRMEHDRSIIPGEDQDEVLLYVRNHLSRHPHTAQFPSEWHVDEFPNEEGHYVQVVSRPTLVCVHVTIFTTSTQFRFTRY